MMENVFQMAPVAGRLGKDKEIALEFPKMDQPFITGKVSTTLGYIPQVASELTSGDRMGTLKARWAIGRMRFTVDPGLYALGIPDAESPVFATANYKMSFDCLRSALRKMSAWILVLDTKGINVWCAAGKGTFGTEELIYRIASSGLDRIVSHRRIILPQLGAPGVAAYMLKKLSGFSAVFGPIKASDIPEFIENGLKATTEMRRKSFTTGERAALIPVELVQALRVGILIIAAFFVLGAFGKGDDYLSAALSVGVLAALGVLTAIFSGAVLTPLLLPWIPGRAFSLKGALVGLAGGALLLVLERHRAANLSDMLDVISWAILVVALSAYLAMNFTGASTYTSLSGVRREMRWAVPMQIAGGIMGLGLMVVSRLI